MARTRTGRKTARARVPRRSHRDAGVREGPGHSRDIAGEVREMVYLKFAGEVEVLQGHLDRYIGRRYFGSLYVLFRALFTTIRRHTAKVFTSQLRAFVDAVEEPMSPALMKKLMAHDIVTLYLRESHPNYPRVRKMGEELALLNREFLGALVRAGVRARAKRWPLTYEEVHRAAFPLRSESKKVLMEQFWKAQHVVNAVQEDLKIVNLPLGKGLIIEALQEGVRYSRRRIGERLDEIYGK